MSQYLTKKQINKAIAHTGLTIHGARGDGCFYFVDATGYCVGRGSVYVCYLHHMTIEQWVNEAQKAQKYGRTDESEVVKSP